MILHHETSSAFIFSSSLAFAAGDVCFEAGECRESHHLEGDAVVDEFQCLENCKQRTGSKDSIGCHLHRHSSSKYCYKFGTTTT
jgi:hypothetical protein